jgi:ribosome-associated translation inhibitor RaiA
LIQSSTSRERFEISPRFRRSIEERIARLERGANDDEARLILLNDPDHIRRQLRLVTTQRCEALRMRIFLDNSRVRSTRTIDAPPQLG